MGNFSLAEGNNLRAFHWSLWHMGWPGRKSREGMLDELDEHTPPWFICIYIYLFNGLYVYIYNYINIFTMLHHISPQKKRRHFWWGQIMSKKNVQTLFGTGWRSPVWPIAVFFPMGDLQDPKFMEVPIFHIFLAYVSGLFFQGISPNNSHWWYIVT